MEKGWSDPVRTPDGSAVGVVIPCVGRGLWGLHPFVVLLSLCWPGSFLNALSSLSSLRNLPEHHNVIAGWLVAIAKNRKVFLHQFFLKCLVVCTRLHAVFAWLFVVLPSRHKWWPACLIFLGSELWITLPLPFLFVLTRIRITTTFTCGWVGAYHVVLWRLVVCSRQKNLGCHSSRDYFWRFFVFSILVAFSPNLQWIWWRHLFLWFLYFCLPSGLRVCNLLSYRPVRLKNLLKWDWVLQVHARLFSIEKKACSWRRLQSMDSGTFLGCLLGMVEAPMLKCTCNPSGAAGGRDKLCCAPFQKTLLVKNVRFKGTAQK